MAKYALIFYTSVLEVQKRHRVTEVIPYFFPVFNFSRLHLVFVGVMGFNCLCSTQCMMQYTLKVLSLEAHWVGSQRGVNYVRTRTLGRTVRMQMPNSNQCLYVNNRLNYT